MLDAAQKVDRTHPTVAIAFHAWGTGGPVSNVQRLSKALRERGCHVVWLTNTHSQHFLPRQPEVDDLHIYSVLGEKRCGVELDTIKPDVLITEQYPFCKDYDDVDTLVEAYRRKVPNGKIYGLSRDIPSDFCVPKAVQNLTVREAVPAAIDWVDRHFDHIFIRGDEKVVPVLEKFAATGKDFTVLENKMSYAGYLIPEPDTHTKTPNDPPKIVVNFGGGGSNEFLGMYKNILEKVNEMSRSWSKPIKADWHFYVGNKSDPKDRILDTSKIDELHRMARKITKTTGVNVIIHPTLPNYLKSIEDADLVVCAGGMSAVEAVSYKKPVVCLPFPGEQAGRASGLKALAGNMIEIYRPLQKRKNEEIDKTMFEETFRKQFARIGKDMGDDFEIKINGHEIMADEIVSRYQSEQLASGNVIPTMTEQVDASTAQHMGQTTIPLANQNTI